MKTIKTSISLGMVAAVKTATSFKKARTTSRCDWLLVNFRFRIALVTFGRPSLQKTKKFGSVSCPFLNQNFTGGRCLVIVFHLENFQITHHQCDISNRITISCTADIWRCCHQITFVKVVEPFVSRVSIAWSSFFQSSPFLISLPGTTSILLIPFFKIMTDGEMRNLHTVSRGNDGRGGKFVNGKKVLLSVLLKPGPPWGQ